MSVKLTIEGARCKVESPYLSSWVTRARQLGGKWTEPCWSFDARVAEDVKAALLDIYGEDGVNKPTLVNVRVEIVNWDDAELVCCGRVLCRRGGRDYSVKVGEGVSVVAGGFPRTGGSVKNPSCRPEDGTILRVLDVPLGRAERSKKWAEEYSGARPYSIEIEPAPKANDESAPTTERMDPSELTKDELVALVRDITKIIWGDRNANGIPTTSASDACLEVGVALDHYLLGACRNA